MISPVFFVFLANVALAQLACPADNEQTYVDPASQATYRIECGYDRPGSDMPGSPGWTDTLEECIALCSQTSGCVDVTFVPGSPGPCYIKNALNVPVAKTGQIGAHQLSAEGVSCPNPNPVCVDVPDYGTCYYTECGSQRAGDVLSQLITTTFEDCIDECEANYLNGCAYVNFAPGVGTILPGGTCTLQSTYSQTLTSAPGYWGSTRESICWNQNGSNETTWFGRTYRLECGTDLDGGDLGAPVWTTGIYGCMLECDQTPGCIGAAWHWGYPTGPCYMKSTVSPSSSNYAVNAAVWLPDCYEGITTITTTVFTTTNFETLQPTATLTITPMYEYNLQSIQSGETPITYGATPSPSTVPGGPQCYGWGPEPGCSGGYKRSAMPEPTAPPDATSPGTPIKARDVVTCAASSTVTTTVSTYSSGDISLSSTCTYYAGAAKTTVPAYCAATFAFNFPAVPSGFAASPQNNISTAPSITTVNKADCCHACARIFNCVWWYFEFGADTPGDPQSPGTCTFAYNTGIYGTGDNTPAICPNGVLGGSVWWDPDALYGYPDETAAFYNTGYSPGPCNDYAVSIYQSSQDAAYPPDYYSKMCPGQNIDDYY
jgi:hypothetical protein